MNSYDKVGKYLYDRILSEGESFYFDTYAASLLYSYDGKDWKQSLEVFEISICDGGVCWFNDWYEGQSYVKLNGIMNLNVLFNQGFYHNLHKEFNDEDTK